MGVGHRTVGGGHKVTLSQVDAGEFRVDGIPTSVYVDEAGGLHFGCHTLDRHATEKLFKLLKEELK